MKKFSITILMAIALIKPSKSAGQTGISTLTGNEITPDGVFDKVYDRFGNEFELADLMLTSTKQIGGGTNSTNSVPSDSCIAGYFTLFYAPGSMFTAGSNSTAAQNVLCELFSNLSGLINSNIPQGAINVYCNNVGSTSTALGVGTPFFLVPQGGLSGKGIMRGQVEKALLSGVDPYLNIPVSAFTNGNNFYHCYMSGNPGYNWNFSMNIGAVSNTEYSFYSLMMHEALHVLGVLSALQQNGVSQLPGFYTKYDQFLVDTAGVPLIVTSTTACPIYNFSFNTALSLSAITPSLCTNTGTYVNLSNCSAAAQYSSSNVHVKVYTPDCWESGSSLSHFEDMCSTSSFIPTSLTGCVATPTSPGKNDLYFVVSNALNTGSCSAKHYPKEQERCVLADLGYNLATTYTSSQAQVVNTSSVYTYSATCPSSANIIGLNDGLLGGNYTFTTTTNFLSVPYSSILANDTPSASLQVSCVAVVYNNATFTMGLNSVNITAPSAGAGFVILSYLPTDGNGKFGNITYIFCNFVSPGCNVASSCNMIQNGGFESTNGSNSCGPYGPVTLGCWDPYQSFPAVLSTTCNIGTSHQLGVNTYSSIPPMGAVSTGAPNTKCVSLLQNEAGSGTAASIKNVIVPAMIQNQIYQLSFWVANITNSYSLNTSNYPIVVSVASHTTAVFNPTVNFPSGLNSIADFTVNAGNAWSLITHTFTYNQVVNANAFVIGVNFAKTVAAGSYSNSPWVNRFCLLDEVSLVPISSVTFAVPQSTCGSVTLTNLAQYASAVSGTFSGQGVTYNGTYNFNSPPTLGPGIYNIAFTFTTSNSCTTTIYSQVSSTACCNSTTIPVFSQTSIPTSTLYGGGPINVVNDVTIQPGAMLTLALGEFIMGNNTKITVANTATLNIQGSHLYTCGDYLWNGIIVQDGGKVMMSTNTIDNLIEDALIAIDVSNNATTTVNPILDIKNTTFNKNYTAVNISNYQKTAHSYSTAFSFSHCVFTCRDFTFTTNSWPQTGIGAAGLRAATNSTTGLTAPFTLQSATVAALKSPYWFRPSYAAISFSNVGVTSGNNLYGIHLGSVSGSTPTADFLLFDSHSYGIIAYNTNLSCVNSVFQNTIRSKNSAWTKTNIGGIAISHRNSMMNSNLDLTGPNYNTGNRFWECHTAVSSKNLLRFNMEYAIIRSSQTNTALGGHQGERGLLMPTNRFQYYIRNNEFTNINTCINIPIAADVYTTISTGTQTGVYADRIIIKANSFSAGTPTTNYVNFGVDIGSVNNFTPTVANDYNVSPFTKGIVVESNTLSNVFRGIYLSGITGYQTSINTNTITLRTDNFFNGSQHAIDLSNTNSAAKKVGQNIIRNNAVTGSTISNTQESLIYCNDNPGFFSPSVTCNYLANSYQGFVFEGPNNSAVWAGNEMQPLERGMMLVNTGVIGVQGSSATAANNLWSGSWTPSVNLCTYVGVSSTATDSPLWVKNTSTTNPPNNSGTVIPQYWYGAAGTLSISVGGDYNCGGVPNGLVWPVPNEENYGTNEYYNISRSALYRFLFFNDSIRDNGDELTEFYYGLSNSNLDKFIQIENRIFEGDLVNSAGIISELEVADANTVEVNYKTFYQLYQNYLTALAEEEYFSPADSSYLYSLANLCPALNGACIYQARALYNFIYGMCLVYQDCTEEPAARGVVDRSIHIKSSELTIKDWSAELIPNPAQDQIQVLTKNENDLLVIQFRDVSGRVVLEAEVRSVNYTISLDLDLINGVYFVSLSNEKGENINRKLIIAK